MRQSNIAFPNLRAEMSRQNIGIVAMAESLKCNRDTLARKLSRRAQLNLDEAFQIQEEFFPGMDVSYLFAPAPVTDSATATNAARPEA